MTDVDARAEKCPIDHVVYEITPQTAALRGEQEAVEFARSRLQRDEIGPVFHDIAHKVYDATEEDLLDRPMWMPVDKRLMVDSFFNRVKGLSGLVEKAAREYLSKPELQEFLEGLNPFGNDVITIPSNQALQEGLTSGVVAPFRLLQSVVATEHYYGGQTKSLDSHDYDFFEMIRNCWGGAKDNIEFSPDSFDAWADRIIDADFQVMLHQLAYAANGYLGSASNDPYMQTKPISSFVTKKTEEVFVTNEDGRAVAFKPEFLVYKRKHMREERLTLGSTGGCPVRHAEFARIGQFATEYLQAVNPDTGRPVNEGESAIARGSRLLSLTLHQLAQVSR